MENVTPRPSYHNLAFRIIAALIAGLFMVFYGSKLNPFEAILMIDFYLSLTGSFIIALLLVNAVHFATVALDRRLNWASEFVPRVLLQSLLGFLFPCMLAYFLAAIYFGAYGLDINADTDYLTFDYPWVVTFLFFLNLYYGFHFVANFFGIHIRFHKWKFQLFLPAKIPGHEMIRKPDDYEDEHSHLPSPIILYKHDAIVSVDVTEKIAYFYCVRKQYWAVSIEGELYAIRQNLSEIEKHYDRYHFFRINRQVILNRKVIAGCQNDDLGQTQVTLHAIPVMQGRELGQSYFIVSGKKAKKFMRWLQS